MGIAGLSILLYVQNGTGSFAAAGAVSSLYVLGLAVAAPLVGRTIDRLGPGPMLLVSAWVYPAALIMLVVLVKNGAAFGWLALSALVAGATLPPITVSMRVLFPRLFADAELLQTAYSFDSILIESIFVAGPALIAIFVAVNLRGGAVLFAAGCAVAGSALFMRSPLIRQWTAPATHARSSLLGPLRIRSLLAIYLATLLYSIAFGLLEVAITALATSQGRPVAAGWILALVSVGSGLGALVYGSRSWAMPQRRQYVVAQFAMAVGLCVLIPVSDLYWLAAFCVIACSPMAPVLAVQSALVAGVAPRAMLAESFTWAATSLLVGVSAGIAAGGAIVESHAPSLALTAASGSTFTAALVSLFALQRENTSNNITG